MRQDLYFCPVMPAKPESPIYSFASNVACMPELKKKYLLTAPRFASRIAVFAMQILIALFLFSSCSPTSKLPENKYLLVKNEIKIEGEGISSSKLKAYLTQLENKKFLGFFNLNLSIYNATSKGDLTGFKRWLRRSVGEPPSIYKEADILSSARQMKLYLMNKGYFNAEISHESVFRNKKAKVIYNVVTKEPYKIRRLRYNIEDDNIRNLVLNNANKSLIKTGATYDFYVLEEERSRVNDFLRNKGYYFMGEDFIFFQIDSALNNHQLDITLLIDQRPGLDIKDSIIVSKLYKKQFKISDIYIYPQLDPLHSNSFIKDTVDYVRLNFRNPDDTLGLYRFLYSEPARIRPKTIVPSIYFGHDEIFSENNVTRTSGALRTLPVFRYANISFDTVRGTLNSTSKEPGLLRCRINMSRAKRNSFLIESEATNSAGMLGIAGNVVVKNKNIFRGAEVFSIKLKGALEMQQSLDDAASTNEFLFFNTVETGIEASLFIPRFWGPISPQRFSRYFRPRTNLLTGLNYQRRPDYERTIANISLGYEWKKNEQITYFLFPLEINAVKIFPSDDFVERLEELNNPRLSSQYSDHMIFALKYSYVKNTQKRGSFSAFHYMRFNFESSGNLLYAIDELVKLEPNDEGNYTLFGIRYAQYLRFDTDLRKYLYIDRDNQIAMRAIFGIGVPYGNSNSLPFEKGFYGGGANGMRGWELKTLGPGIYKSASSTKYEVMGDIKLEANIEYRFPIYSILKGALFADIGNVWLLNSSDVYPGGTFDFSNFYKQFALDAGLGFRLDFEFFVIRVDGALPIKDPGAEEEWVIKKARFADVMWNFGIGYPF